MPVQDFPNANIRNHSKKMILQKFPAQSVKRVILYTKEQRRRKYFMAATSIQIATMHSGINQRVRNVNNVIHCSLKKANKQNAPTLAAKQVKNRKILQNYKFPHMHNFVVCVLYKNDNFQYNNYAIRQGGGTG